MSDTVIVKNLPKSRTGALQVLVRKGKNYYKVSYLDNDYVRETLAFKCDENGHVESYADVAGGSLMGMAEVIQQIRHDKDL